MGRLARFPHNRWIGVRTNFRVYDCDDEAQFAALEAVVAKEQLLDRRKLSSFGPDSLAEARNRGYRPVTDHV